MGEVTRKEVEMLGISHRTSEAHDHVTLSIGVTSLHPGENITQSALLERADKALYEAKNSGRNRVVAQSVETEV